MLAQEWHQRPLFICKFRVRLVAMPLQSKLGAFGLQDTMMSESPLAALVSSMERLEPVS